MAIKLNIHTPSEFKQPFGSYEIEDEYFGLQREIYRDENILYAINLKTGG